jgi:hypothetical protein
LAARFGRVEVIWPARPISSVVHVLEFPPLLHTRNP